MNDAEKASSALEERRLADYREVLARFGAAWKRMPIETVIGYTSSYEVVGSETTGDIKRLTLRRKSDA